jgi:hypothetical protein
MALEDLVLQGHQVVLRDPGVRQDAKACVNAIDGSIIFRDGPDMLLAGPDIFHGCGRE